MIVVCAVIVAPIVAFASKSKVFTTDVPGVEPPTKTCIVLLTEVVVVDDVVLGPVNPQTAIVSYYVVARYSVVAGCGFERDTVHVVDYYVSSYDIGVRPKHRFLSWSIRLMENGRLCYWLL